MGTIITVLVFGLAIFATIVAVVMSFNRSTIISMASIVPGMFGVFVMQGLYNHQWEDLVVWYPLMATLAGMALSQVTSLRESIPPALPTPKANNGAGDIINATTALPDGRDQGPSDRPRTHWSEG